MQPPDFPPDETARQQALNNTDLLDTPPEERFDRLTRLARQALNTPVALVSLIDGNRQWVKSAQGLDISETPRDISFCGHTILGPEVMVVEDTHGDPRFCDNPLVLGAPNIRFYAGAPLHSRDGFRLGTLCLVDYRPRRFTTQERQTLRDFAGLVEREINIQSDDRAIQALRDSERRARSVIEGTRAGTWEWNVQTGATVFNERWAGICGYTLAELAPVSIRTWEQLTHPEDRVEAERKLQAHFSGATYEYDVRFRMLHKEGQDVWVHARGRVFEWTDAGEPLMMYGTHMDITRDMQRLHRMEQQNRALAILNDLALDQVSSESEKIRIALEQGAELLGLPVAILSEVTGDAYMIRAVRAPESSGLAVGQRFPLARTYCSIMLEKGAPLSIEHMSQSSYRNHICYRSFGLESYIGAPVVIAGHVFGTLNFASPEPRSRRFTKTEITFVTLLGKWLSSLMEGEITSRKLSKLVRQTPGMLYQFRLWPNGHSAFPYASPGIRDIYGCSPEAVVNDARAIFKRTHPEDLPALMDSIRQSYQELDVWQHQYRVRGDTGWRWVEGRASPERLADDSVIWHGYINDINDIKRTQLALQESEAQLRRLFELSPIGIAFNDLYTGEFLDVNDALLAPTGYDRDSFLQLELNDLVTEPLDELRYQALDETRQTGRYGPYEMHVVRKDGSNFPAIVQGMVIRDSSDRVLVWSLVEDISERKKVERMKNEFISTVSHELRTPLTSIAGSLGLIASGTFGPLPEKAAQLLEIAARNSDQLKHLINDLLDMDKLVSGKIRMQIESGPIYPVIASAVEQLHTYALDQEVRVALVRPAEELTGHFDPHRLQQAFMNLLSNAIKFSPRGGRVSIAIESRHDHIRISVTDQGAGIPADFRDRLFTKFAQADSSTTRGRRGTGLGLAITRDIMTQMGGNVGFRTEEGKGSTFWLVLPRES